MKKILHVIFTFILIALVASPTLPVDARRSKSKAKTTQTSKRKSSKRKSRSSSRRSSSRFRTSNVGAAPQAVVTDPTPHVTAPASLRGGSAASTASPAARASSGSLRKVKVEKPDLEKIRQETLDPKSKFYFPKLMAKYEVNDTTMTPEEFRNLYLGYMFQEDFDPYRVSPYSGITDELRMKPTHTKEEIDTITKYALLSLQDNPFDLRQMSFLIHVLKERRKDMRAKIWEYRLEHLLGAIKSTGTGEDLENAWFVIYPVHEYDMVQLLGYEATDAEFFDPGYDYLTVQPDESDTRKRDKSAKGFYFNIMLPQKQYELKHPEELLSEPEDLSAPAAGAAEAAPEATSEQSAPDPDEIPAE